jgi:GntR family transcriptional regulator
MPGMQQVDPVVEQVRRAILGDISSGSLPPGSKLPAERDLAERLGVSRSTLRHTLAALEEAGIVTRRPGRGGGTFVAHPKVTRDLSHVTGLPAYLERQGYKAGARVLSTSIREPEPSVRAKLQLPADAMVVQVVRVRLADGSPISLETANFPADRFGGLLDHGLGGSLYELIREQYDVEPSEALEEIEVVQATPDEARLLGITPKSPLMMIRRVALDQQGVAFECSQDLFRADRTQIFVRSPGRGIRAASGGNGDPVELRVH